MGDVNGDGKPDLVFVSNSSSGPSTLLGNGQGGFSDPILSSTGNFAFGAGGGAPTVALGDLNGDGLLDLAALSSANSGIGLCYGMGSGSFQSGTILPAGNSASFHALAVADVNNDGKLDIVYSYVGPYYSGLADFIGNPSGGLFTFTSGGNYVLWSAVIPPTITVAKNIVGLVARDFNGDGVVDYAVTGSGVNNGFLVPVVVVLYRTIAGGVLSVSSTMLSNVNNNYSYIVCGDFNGDSSVDAAVGGFGTPSIIPLLNNGITGFSQGPSIPIDGSLEALASGDLNGDGNDEIVAYSIQPAGLNFTYGDVSVVFGAASGQLGTPVNYYAGGSGSDSFLKIADVNGDGHLDVMSPSHWYRVMVLLGDGAGGLITNGRAQLGPSLSTNPEGSCVGDLDRDGNPDVVTTGGVGAAVHVLLGIGTGGFGSATSYPGSFGGNVTLADLDGDEILDAALSAPGGGNLIVLLMGNGAGGFGAQANLGNGGIGLNGYMNALAIGDFNGDGRPDIVATNLGYGYSVFLGIGGGSFGFPQNATLPASPNAVVVADLNGDGTLDLVIPLGTVGASPDHMVGVLIGNGLGAFSASSNVTVGLYPIGAAVGDLNSDGTRDIATVNYTDGSVSVLLGNGTGAFGAATSFDVKGNSPAPNGFLNPNAIALGDLNADGKHDIVVSTYQSQSIAALFGDGAGHFSSPSFFSGGSYPSSISLGDLNIDGQPDIVSTNMVSDDLSVYLNRRVAPLGTSQYGSGTHGCFGMIGVSTSGPAQVNTPSFAFVCTNAPTETLGLLLIADAQDTIGHDLFGIGAVMLLDFFSAAEVFGFNMYSGEGGSAAAPAPIPNSPAVVGKTYFAQSAWVENAHDGQACGPSPFHILTSRGLAFVIQM
jgi:hypothetical protein